MEKRSNTITTKLKKVCSMYTIHEHQGQCFVSQVQIITLQRLIRGAYLVYTVFGAKVLTLLSRASTLS